jgi:hypothetical protein
VHPVLLPTCHHLITQVFVTNSNAYQMQGKRDTGERTYYGSSNRLGTPPILPIHSSESRHQTLLSPAPFSMACENTEWRLLSWATGGKGKAMEPREHLHPEPSREDLGERRCAGRPEVGFGRALDGGLRRARWRASPAVARAASLLPVHWIKF